MRTAATGLAFLVLAAACSLVQPPGTRPVVARVTNTDPMPVRLSIETSAGVPAGGVQPGSLPARGTGMVTFFLPAGDDWSIMVDDTPMFFAADLL
jgi:hypothetical protein